MNPYELAIKATDCVPASALKRLTYRGIWELCISEAKSYGEWSEQPEEFATVQAATNIVCASIIAMDLVRESNGG